MSEILDLARDFERKSKQLANSTDKALRKEFSRHEKRIADALRESEKKICADIDLHQRRMRRLVLKTWGWLALTILLVAAASAPTIWWTGQKIRQNIEQMEQMDSFGIRIIQSQGQAFLVLPKGARLSQQTFTTDGRTALMIEQEN